MMDICDLIGKMDTDATIYAFVDAICDSVPSLRRKGKLSGQQEVDCRGCTQATASQRKAAKPALHPA